MGNVPARKTPAKKAPGKKPPAKKPVANEQLPANSRKRLWKPSPALAAIIGTTAARRDEITKRVWGYIVANKLAKGMTVRADAKLKRITNLDKVPIMAIGKLVDAHLT